MRKIILYLYFVIVIVVCSCSLLTRTVKTTNEDSQKTSFKNNLRETAAIDKSKTMQYMYRGKDSLLSAYQIQLWPKGKIVFNDQFGFEGEFDSIIMKGNLHKLSTQEALSKVKEEDKSKIGLDMNSQSTNVTENKSAKVERFPDYVWMLICGLILAAALFFIIRRLIK